MSELLPSYYHLSPTQIDGLSFHVTLKCVGVSGDGEDHHHHHQNESTNETTISWQERIPKPSSSNNTNHENNLSIFTYTSAYVVNNQEVARGFSFRNEIEPHSVSKHSRVDRLHREDPCDVMVIMATVGDQDEELILSVIKVYPNTGLVSTSPQLSEVEAEDCEDSKIFLSDRGMNRVIDKGQRLTTYSFVVSERVYEYTIVMNDGANTDNDAELRIAEQHNFDRDNGDKRRGLIRKEYDAFDCMYEQNDWDKQAHIEIVSADGFVESNLLLCAPHGSNLVVRYKIIKSSCCITTKKREKEEEEEVIVTGTTSSIQSYCAVRATLEFIAHFIVAFVGIAFALLLWFGDCGSNFSRTLLFSTIPLVLIIHLIVIGDTSLYHINHQITLLYNDCSTPNGEEVTFYDNEEFIEQATRTTGLVLELQVYFKHNFGVTSLAGLGTITLPNEPGTHDIVVPTWRPISSSGISTAKGQMYDFYLGSSCCDVGPRDPVSTTTLSEEKFEHDMDTDIQLFSKAGLHTEGSGSIHVKVNIMHNYFNDGDATQQAEALSGEESSYHRVKMRETVDEVLSRVRRNKRGRMARVVHTSSSSDQTTRINECTVSNSTVSAAAEETKDMSRDRTAKVLDRVRSRRKQQWS